EIREAGHRGALVGLSAFTPGIEQILATSSENCASGNRLLSLEARAINDAVHCPLGTLAINNDVTLYLADAVGQHIHMVLIQRRIIVIGDQHPLAAKVEIRRDFVAQLLVLDLVADMATRLKFTDFQDSGIADKAQYSGFQHPVNALTERVQSLRYFAKQHPLQRANLPVRLGHDPR